MQRQPFHRRMPSEQRRGLFGMVFSLGGGEVVLRRCYRQRQYLIKGSTVFISAMFCNKLHIPTNATTTSIEEIFFFSFFFLQGNIVLWENPHFAGWWIERRNAEKQNAQNLTTLSSLYPLVGAAHVSRP